MNKTNPLDTQVGGSHYKQYKIQPYEFFHANNVPHHKAAIIRRILRYDHPTGKGIEDLKKIQHEIDLIIELEQLIDPELIDRTSEFVALQIAPEELDGRTPVPDPVSPPGSINAYIQKNK